MTDAAPALPPPPRRSGERRPTARRPETAVDRPDDTVRDDGVLRCGERDPGRDMFRPRFAAERDAPAGRRDRRQAGDVPRRGDRPVFAFGASPFEPLGTCLLRTTSAAAGDADGLSLVDADDLATEPLAHLRHGPSHGACVRGAVLAA